MDVHLKYVGQSFLLGVPARDLTRAEAEALGISRLLKSGLYVKVQEPPAEKPRPGTNKSLRGGLENKSPYAGDEKE